MSVNPHELIPVEEVAAAQAQLELDGHVGLSGVYDPALGEQAIIDAQSSAHRERPRVRGEQVTTLRTVTERRQKALHMILEGVHNHVRSLGHEIAPQTIGEKALLQLIRMDTHTEGPHHIDSANLVDVVGIATLRGASKVRFEADGADYPLTPGDLVVHDLSRQLRHWGYTEDSQRVGLAIARVGGPRLLRRKN